MREFYEAVKQQKRGRIGWILCWICGCMWGAFVGRWGSYYAAYPQMSRGAKLLDCIAVGLSFFCAACWLFETFNSLFPYHVSEENEKKGIERGCEKRFWIMMRTHSFDWRTYLRYPALRLLALDAATTGLFLLYGILGWQGPETVAICIAEVFLASALALVLTIRLYARGVSGVLYGIGDIIISVLRSWLILFSWMLAGVWVLKRFHMLPQNYLILNIHSTADDCPVVALVLLLTVAITFIGDWYEGMLLSKRSRFVVRVVLTAIALLMIGIWLCYGVDWHVLLSR